MSSADVESSASKNADIIALGWQVHNDKRTGRDYYYNPATRETRWQRPTAAATASTVEEGIKSTNAAGATNSKTPPPADTSAITSPTASTAPSMNNINKKTLAPSNAGSESKEGSPPAISTSAAFGASAAKSLFENKAAAEAAIVTMPSKVKGDSSSSLLSLKPVVGGGGGALKASGALTSPTMGLKTAPGSPLAAANASTSPSSSVAKGGTAAAKTGGKGVATNANTTIKKAQPAQEHVSVENSTNSAEANGEVESSALAALLEQNKRLQEMIAAGMSGPIALDFGGRMDALTRTNNALTIQIERLTKEHSAMLKALTEANVKIYELSQEVEELKGVNRKLVEQRATSSSDREESGKAEARGSSSEGETETETAMVMAHLRETNRTLVQQVGELSALLARSLADQSFVMAAATQAQTAAVPVLPSGGGGPNHMIESLLHVHVNSPNVSSPSKPQAIVGGGGNSSQLPPQVAALLARSTNQTPPPPASTHQSSQSHHNSTNASTFEDASTTHQRSQAYPGYAALLTSSVGGAGGLGMGGPPSPQSYLGGFTVGGSRMNNTGNYINNKNTTTSNDFAAYSPKYQSVYGSSSYPYSNTNTSNPMPTTRTARFLLSSAPSAGQEEGRGSSLQGVVNYDEHDSASGGGANEKWSPEGLKGGNGGAAASSAAVAMAVGRGFGGGEGRRSHGAADSQTRYYDNYEEEEPAAHGYGNLGRGAVHYSSAAAAHPYYGAQGVNVPFAHRGEGMVEGRTGSASPPFGGSQQQRSRVSVSSGPANAGGGVTMTFGGFIIRN